MEPLDPTPLLYPKCLLQEWRDGPLRDVWVDMYPGLFCDEDGHHRNQEPYGYGFGDWFTSIRIHFRFPNCTVLKRSYFREKDPTFRRATEIVGERGMEVITKIRKLTRKNPPDLLVRLKSGEFFFVEVKRKPDRLSDAQESAFRRIETELGCKVLVATLKRASGLEGSSMAEECRKAFEQCMRRRSVVR